VVAGLLGIVLLLFELVLIARMVVDWIGVLSPVGGRSGLYQARRITHGMTEPVIGPVRRVLKPARFGSVSIDRHLPQCLWLYRPADRRGAVDSVLRRSRRG
jgi:YggT family protein